MIWRGYLDYVYYTCQRCNRKWPLSDMSWDNGLLVCNEICHDRTIVGAVELAQAKEASRDRNELTPDKKLIHPVDPRVQIETVPASSGTY